MIGDSDILAASVPVFPDAGRWTTNCGAGLEIQFCVGANEVLFVSLGDESSLCGLALVTGILCWDLDSKSSVCAFLL